MFKTITLISALFIGSMAFAQESTDKKEDKKEMKTPAERASRLTERMTKQLVLTADQAQKVSEVNTGIASKNEAVRTATNMTPVQKKEALAGNRGAQMEMYKGILTPEQMTKCEKMFAKKEAKKAAKGKAKKDNKAKKTTTPEVESEEDENEL